MHIHAECIRFVANEKVNFNASGGPQPLPSAVFFGAHVAVIAQDELAHFEQFCVAATCRQSERGGRRKIMCPRAGMMNSQLSALATIFQLAALTLNGTLSPCLDPQLNQQQNQSKGATTQDFSFLKEASPIYVTSLSSNHVSGTTTLTTGVSNLPGSNCVSTSSTSAVQLSNSQQNNNNQSVGASAVSTHQVHVHQPLSAKLPPQPTPLAGGWLIGESAQGTLITPNNQQVFQNLNTINNNNSNNNNLTSTNNNLNSVTSGNNNFNHISCSGSEKNDNSNIHSGATVKTALAASSSSCGDISFSRFYGNQPSATAASNYSEFLANGHVPRREVSSHFSRFGTLPRFRTAAVAEVIEKRPQITNGKNV